MNKLIIAFATLFTVGFIFIASPAQAWVNSPRCNLDNTNSTDVADAKVSWARSMKTQRSDATYLSPASNIEILNNPSFHLYPIYTTYEGITFRGPGPAMASWQFPTGGYPQGQGPNGSMYKAGANGLVSTNSIQSVPYTYKPSGVYNEWVCQPGCYTPEQEIRYSDGGFVAIEEAVENGVTDIVTLTPDSTLKNLKYMANKIISYTFDMKEIEQDILHFRTASGGELRVTILHPIVTRMGTIKPAQGFKVGDSLVREDGTLDRIVSIERSRWFGKAYNLRPESTDLVSNVVVAQGYLNGSGRYQFEYLQELNRIILRENIPADLIPAVM